MHVVFENLNGKILSLTWSKKYILIGQEALHQNPRPKTQDPSPSPRPKPKSTPSRAGLTAAATRAWGAILSSEAVYTLICLRLIYTPLMCFGSSMWDFAQCQS